MPQNNNRASLLQGFGLGILAGAAAAVATALGYEVYQEDREARAQAAAAAAAGTSVHTAGPRGPRPPRPVTPLTPRTPRPRACFSPPRAQTTPSRPRQPVAKNNDRSLCVVCKANPRIIVLSPCQHLCLCVPCSKRIIQLPEPKQVCPLCHTHIDDLQAAITQ